MAEEEPYYSFDERVEVLDHVYDKKAGLEIYILTEDKDKLLTFIPPDDEEFALSPEDAVKFFILLGEALKSVGKVSKLKINLEYELLE